MQACRRLDAFLKVAGKGRCYCGGAMDGGQHGQLQVYVRDNTTSYSRIKIVEQVPRMVEKAVECSTGI